MSDKNKAELIESGIHYGKGLFRIWAEQDGIDFDAIEGYSNPNTIKKHEKNIKILLDINFGKDWRCCVILYHWTRVGKHRLQAKNLSPEELALVHDKWKRSVLIWGKIYSATGNYLIDFYLTRGFRETEKAINTGKYRLTWDFKNTQDPTKIKKEVIYSSNLYHRFLRHRKLSQNLQPKNLETWKTDIDLFDVDVEQGDNNTDLSTEADVKTNDNTDSSTEDISEIDKIIAQL